MHVISCNAPYAEGGQGVFLANLVETFRARNELLRYYSVQPRGNDPLGQLIDLGRYRWLFQRTPLRWSQPLRELLSSLLFDRAVASTIDEAGEGFVGFSGRCLYSMRRARRLGYKQLGVESPTSHVDNVLVKHRLAKRFAGFDSGWLSPLLAKRMKQEYEEADRIYVPSQYVLDSFLAAGIAASKIQLRKHGVLPRYKSIPVRKKNLDGFRVLYVGRLEVAKGVTLLIEAFHRLEVEGAELVLVGGTATSTMSRYIKGVMSQDHRIRWMAGDPLLQLLDADVFVHPSFEDGLALAPMEALACRVPVIATEDTGMKTFLKPGYNGYIVPTGDVKALHQAMLSVHEKPLKGTFDVPDGIVSDAEVWE